jgi:hypothetical protein
VRPDHALCGVGKSIIPLTPEASLVWFSQSSRVKPFWTPRPNRVLLLVGQEVHDQARNPQKNHLLVFNANRDVATFAPDPQRLVTPCARREAYCRLIKDGRVLKEWKRNDNFAHITTEPGVYRVEAYHRYLGRRVGWIFSNPIYIK